MRFQRWERFEREFVNHRPWPSARLVIAECPDCDSTFGRESEAEAVAS